MLAPRPSLTSLSIAAGLLLLYAAGCGSNVTSTAATSNSGGLATTGGARTNAGAPNTAGTGAVVDAAGLVWRTANLTNYTSYPDPNSEECIAYNGCTWAGQFAALDGVQLESWVAANNIASVHSKDFPQYRLKTLRLRQASREIDVKVYDMCADSDCDGCCTANSSSTGFLIDIESYTMQRFGSGDGIVDWACLDC